MIKCINASCIPFRCTSMLLLFMLGSKVYVFMRKSNTNEQINPAGEITYKKNRKLDVQNYAVYGSDSASL